MLTKTEWNNLLQQINHKFDKLEEKINKLEQELSKPSRTPKQTISKKSTETT